MSDALETIGPRNGAAPLAVTVTDVAGIDLSSAFAHYDGAAAAGNWRPALTVRAQNGTILARVFPSDALTAGDTADVTFGPFLGSDTALGDTVVTEQSFGQASSPGTAAKASREDHTHGTPTAPTPGDIALLADATLAVDGTFNLSGLSQAYTDLIVVVIARGTRALASDALLLQFNGDTGNNYDTLKQSFTSGATSIVSQNGLSSYYVADYLPAATAGVGRFLMGEIAIPGYSSTAWYKTANYHGGGDFNSPTGKSTELSSGWWISTAAITSVQLFGFITPNLAAGSRVRVYGRA